jgi:hypothetical protein
MSFDDLTEKAVERTLDSLRPELETNLRSLVDEVARVLAEAQVRETKVALEAVRKEADAQLANVQEELGARISSLERQLVEVRLAAESEARTEGFEAEKEHRAQLASAVEGAQTKAYELALTGAVRLVESVRVLDEATSLDDTLLRLAEEASREADRVAVLVVKEQRLRGWSFLGFDDMVQVAGDVILDPRDSGLLCEVVRTGLVISSNTDHSRQNAVLALPSFADSDTERQAIALPVLVGGSVVSVLYADVAQTDPPLVSSRWTVMLEVLVRHASRMAEGMLVAQSSGVTIPRPAAR